MVFWLLNWGGVKREVELGRIDSNWVERLIVKGELSIPADASVCFHDRSVFRIIFEYV